MFAVAMLVVLAQPAGGWIEWRFAAGQGTPFVAYLNTCTDTQPAKTEGVPGNIGWKMQRCVASMSKQRETTHSHGVRLRAIEPGGKTACEVSTTFQPNLPSRVIAAVEALYPLQPPPSSKVVAGTYKIQICRKEIVPEGAQREDSQPEYCSAFGTLQVRAGVESLRCTLTSH